MKTIIEGGTIVNEGRTFDGTIVIEDGNITEIVQLSDSKRQTSDSDEVTTMCISVSPD